MAENMAIHLNYFRVFIRTRVIQENIHFGVVHKIIHAGVVVAAILKFNMAVMGGQIQRGQLIGYAQKHGFSRLNYFRIFIKTRVIKENIHLGVAGGGHL